MRHRIRRAIAPFVMAGLDPALSRGQDRIPGQVPEMTERVT
jgi:hypothetical protein